MGLIHPTQRTGSKNIGVSQTWHVVDCARHRKIKSKDATGAAVIYLVRVSTFCVCLILAPRRSIDDLEEDGKLSTHDVLVPVRGSHEVHSLYTHTRKSRETCLFFIHWLLFCAIKQTHKTHVTLPHQKNRSPQRAKLRRADIACAIRRGVTYSSVT